MRWVMAKDEKKVEINEERISDNWCFVCKDGGDMIICDFKECLKPYHPTCVGKPESYLKSKRRWKCAWHSCSLCKKRSDLHCYTCTTSFCRRCIPRASFLQVKDKYGFCNECLKLALLIEENKNYDSDGVEVDFADLNTEEGLFKEYYEIIKDQEEFEARDIYAAQDRVKKKKKQLAGSGSEDLDEDEEVSEYDGCLEIEKKKRPKTKRSKRQKPEKKKSNQMEFCGWGSKPLIEFLSSIGKSPIEKLSQQDVTSIINQYIIENKLFNIEKRKRMVKCDALLQSLFKKKTINKNRVSDLLDDHFAENQLHESEEDDELATDSDNNSASTLAPRKCQTTVDMETNYEKIEPQKVLRRSVYASIVVENLKLIYLKKSVLYELQKEPDSFEEKVIGCFVRVKVDRFDRVARIHQHLVQVKGVRKVPDIENSPDFILEFSVMPKETRISMVSDGDFFEEEFEDLKKKLQSGVFERPTVAELEKKAKILHEEITKDWIKKELHKLRSLMDRANGFGWRREFYELSERRKKLETPSEQQKLLDNVPTVIPDFIELDSDTENIKNEEQKLLDNVPTVIPDIIELDFDIENIKKDMKSDEGYFNSILQCNSPLTSDGCQNKRTSEEKTPCIGHASEPQPGDKPDSVLVPTEEILNKLRRKRPRS